MKKELVISAFNEDYSWIDGVENNVKKTIYRKGYEKLLDNEIYIKNNVGRDVHTFFYHICENYNRLSDVIFFSQDYPFDHVENYVEIINGNFDVWEKNSIVTFGGYYGYHWNSIKIPTSRAGIMWTLYPSSHFGEKCKVLICNSNGHPQDHNPKINVDSVWDILFHGEKPNNYEFVPGGHFNITKEQILKRSLDFYKLILNLLESDEIMPWNIERLECYIFNEKYKSKI